MENWILEQLPDDFEDQGFLGALEAFSAGAHPLEFSSFDAAEGEARRAAASLDSPLLTCLTREVDQSQAEIFLRRYHSVLELMHRLSDEAMRARLLRTVFVLRLDRLVLARASAVRIRGAIDYFYSRTALLYHQLLTHQERTTVPEMVAATVWKKICKGMFHGLMTGNTGLGPQRINVLKLDRNRFDFQVRVFSHLDQTPFAEQVTRAGAEAGISGGFFLYSEPDIEPPSRRFDPVGLVLSRGRVLHPPIFERSCFLVDERGHHFIEKVGFRGVTLKAAGDLQVRVNTVNRMDATTRGPVLFNRAWRSPRLEWRGPVVAVVGSRIMSPGPEPFLIPLNGALITFPNRPEWAQLAQELISSGRADYVLPELHGIQGPQEAMAGGPLLLDRSKVTIDFPAEDFLPGVPPATFGGEETGDTNLLPRMALGLTSEKSLVIAAVDGRNIESALGLTLQDTARLMLHLGCVSAMNLDGGSSKRMVIRGKTVDQSSTELETGGAGPDVREDRVRPVHSGLLIFQRKDEGLPGQAAKK